MPHAAHTCVARRRLQRCRHRRRYPGTARASDSIGNQPGRSNFPRLVGNVLRAAASRRDEYLTSNGDTTQRRRPVPAPDAAFLQCGTSIRTTPAGNQTTIAGTPRCLTPGSSGPRGGGAGRCVWYRWLPAIGICGDTVHRARPTYFAPGVTGAPFRQVRGGVCVRRRCSHRWRQAESACGGP